MIRLIGAKSMQSEKCGKAGGADWENWSYDTGNYIELASPGLRDTLVAAEQSHDLHAAGVQTPSRWSPVWRRISSRSSMGARRGRP